jgi:hypothetical protein
VHRPTFGSQSGVQPVAAGAIPLTGVVGDGGMVVRLPGTVNADIGAAETLLGYISFSDLDTVTLLDRGGDVATLAGGRIAVTVNEAFTPSTGLGGFSLRVYETDGDVLFSGPCWQHSVPATLDGSLFAYFRFEGFVLGEDRDMNGDGDKTDVVVAAWAD